MHLPKFLRACLPLAVMFAPLPAEAAGIPAEVEAARTCVFRALTGKVRSQEPIEDAVQSANRGCRDAFERIGPAYERDMRPKYGENAKSLAGQFAASAKLGVRNDARLFLYNERLKLPYGWDARRGPAEATESAKCAGLMRWMASLSSDAKTVTIYQGAYNLLMLLARTQLSGTEEKPEQQLLEGSASEEAQQLQAALRLRSGTADKQAFVDAQNARVKACSLRLPQPVGPTPALEEYPKQPPLIQWPRR